MSVMLLLITLLVPAVLCYPKYSHHIPNGGNVPNPCSGGGTWKGVGHLDISGGGDRNLFGEDFASAGHQWTHDLCHADSDGDGVTNGAELGDPGCTWTQGQHDSGTPLGHPGVCEPMDSATCQAVNQHVIC